MNFFMQINKLKCFFVVVVVVFFLSPKVHCTKALKNIFQ